MKPALRLFHPEAVTTTLQCERAIEALGRRLRRFMADRPDPIVRQLYCNQIARWKARLWELSHMPGPTDAGGKRWT